MSDVKRMMTGLSMIVVGVLILIGAYVVGTAWRGECEANGGVPHMGKCMKSDQFIEGGL